jgi:ribosomal protein S14
MGAEGSGMTDDLFAAAKVDAPTKSDKAKKPRADVRIWNGRLTHDCSRCGTPNAVYGEGVRLLKDEPGKWWCGPCWRLELERRGER